MHILSVHVIYMVVLIALLLAPANAWTLSDIPTTATWVTNGPVRAIVCTPSTTYIGGDFTVVGPVTGYGVPFSSVTGRALTTYPKVNGEIDACLPDGANGWYIGGRFTKVGAFTRNYLAHILANGSVDTTWNPNANNNILALARSGGTVYAGGEFTSIGGQTRNHIAALDAVTGTPTTWNPNAGGGGYYNHVCALAVANGTVYTGGWFTSIGGQTRNHIAALDAATGVATTWNPNAGSDNSNDPTVYALTVAGGVVYAGGTFTSIGGQMRNSIAALEATTGAATTWNPQPTSIYPNNPDVYALAVSGGAVYVGGGFSSIGGQTRNNIAALNATTGVATTWNPNAGSDNSNYPTVYALAISGGAVYAGGGFTSIGGQMRNGIAALDAATGIATTWNPNAGGKAPCVLALAVSGSGIYVGGNFTSIGGQARNGLAALDAATGVATTWNPNPSGGNIYNPTVSALAVSGGAVYVGGNFTNIGGQPRNNIAALNAATGVATTWNPNANTEVKTLAVSGATVYAGGWFTSMGGHVRNHIAALDAASGATTTWNPSADGGVLALAVTSGMVYAGGWFTSMGGQTRNFLAALDATTGAPTSWNPNASGPLPYVHALAVAGGTAYAGGKFTYIGGQPHYYIAATDAATGTPTTWNPQPTSIYPNNPYVYALAIVGRMVYVGGGFTSIGGQLRNHIAELDAATGVATAWNPNVGGTINTQYCVYALAVSGGAVYVGGDFHSIGGQPQTYFARFDPIRNAVPAAQWQQYR